MQTIFFVLYIGCGIVLRRSLLMWDCFAIATVLHNNVVELFIAIVTKVVGLFLLQLLLSYGVVLQLLQ